jgi:CheY-like chemotaxis protein
MSGDTPTNAAKPLRILLVDDDTLISLSTLYMLEDLGHETVEANSGAQALVELGKGRPFDLLITDFSMPQMTGGQLAEAVRRTHPDLPILLATGHAEVPKGVSIELPRIGKPYSVEQLAAEIARLTG